MANMQDQAEIARAMTGSTLSDDKIFEQVSNMNPSVKNQSSKEVDTLVKVYDGKFDKVFANNRIGFNIIANKYGIDGATLFWIYMDWRNRI